MIFKSYRHSHDLYKIYMETHIPIIIRADQKEFPAKIDSCLRNQLGHLINIQWSIQQGQMVLESSQQKQFRYQNLNGVERYMGVPFEHGESCPLLDDKIEKKSQKFIKPCACVLIMDKNNQNVLITRRSEKISFGGAWVLPGGHLQKKQTIIEGGLREGAQEVGLTQKQAKMLPSKGIMAWESCFLQKNVLVSSAIVIFFPVLTELFEVKVQEHEVCEFKWKHISDKSDEKRYSSNMKDGYGEGHLKYLDYYREIRKQEKKISLI